MTLGHSVDPHAKFHFNVWFDVKGIEKEIWPSYYPHVFTSCQGYMQINMV